MQNYGDGGGGGRATRLSNLRQQQQRLTRPVRKVQVIYYLSRNGQLEHPHFMELPYLPNRQLRLRDVTERLTLLRGKAMPPRFSWSCKRSYKNGYVWNDLTEDDIIYPADGVEYVLKGSEIIPDSSERFRHIRTSGRRQKPLPVSDTFHLESEEEEEEEALVEEEEKNARNSKCAASDDAGRCSRGVSTEETERLGTRVDMPLDDTSPSPSPSTTSSDKPGGRNTSQRFEDTDRPSSFTRGSALLQLIACGSAVLKGGKIASSGSGASKSASSTVGSAGELNRHEQGAASRCVSRATAAEEEELRAVPENPRLRRHLVEDKEYFSGSIVEGSKYYLRPSLQKSSSCNEQRSLVFYGDQEHEGWNWRREFGARGRKRRRGGREREVSPRKEEVIGQATMTRAETCMSYLARCLFIINAVDIVKRT